MKPRARRVTIVAAALGVGVVGVLVVAHWGAVRDHVEAWHFQLTQKTVTIEPNLGFYVEATLPPYILLMLAHSTSQPVVFDPGDPPPAVSCKEVGENAALTEAVQDPDGPTMLEESEVSADAFSRVPRSAVLRILKGFNFRVIEQRFPRRAYVVIRDQGATRVIPMVE
jgi:hypothetical protein